MRKEYTNLSCEELCDLMCGCPEDEETDYQVQKNKVRQEAMEWQDSFADGQKYHWSEIAEKSDYFYKKAKRYGLLKEFKENGIL